MAPVGKRFHNRRNLAAAPMTWRYRNETIWRPVVRAPLGRWPAREIRGANPSGAGMGLGAGYARAYAPHPPLFFAETGEYSPAPDPAWPPVIALIPSPVPCMPRPIRLQAACASRALTAFAPAIPPAVTRPAGRKTGSLTRL